MSNPFAMNGTGAAPAQPSAPGPFVLELPADPAWEPMDIADVLEQDGYYSGRIVREKAKTDGDRPGVWLTIELLDTDCAGKKVQKFLGDPRVNPKLMFLWRGILRSISGSTDAAKGAFAYSVGRFTGATVYFKTEAYPDRETGDHRTGVQDWLTQAEYDQAVQKGQHRWPAKIRASSGSTPTGLPAGFGVAFPPAPPAAAPMGQQVGTVPAPANSNGALPAPPAPPAAAPAFAFPGLKK